MFSSLAYTAVLAGTATLSRWPILGWALRIVGDLGWIPLGYVLGVWSIAAWAAAFAAIDVYWAVRSFRGRPQLALVEPAAQMKDAA